jgi:hypothetical protein
MGLSFLGTARNQVGTKMGVGEPQSLSSENVYHNLDHPHMVEHCHIEREISCQIQIQPQDELVSDAVSVVLCYDCNTFGVGCSKIVLSLP